MSVIERNIGTAHLLSEPFTKCRSVSTPYRNGVLMLIQLHTTFIDFTVEMYRKLGNTSYCSCFIEEFRIPIFENGTTSKSQITIKPRVQKNATIDLNP